MVVEKWVGQSEKFLGHFLLGKHEFWSHGLYSRSFNLIFRKKPSSMSAGGGKEFGEERKTRNAFNGLCTLWCEPRKGSHPHGSPGTSDLPLS